MERWQIRLLSGLACALALGIGLWLGLTVLLPWLLPFLLAYALAALLEPPVCKLIGLHLPRWVAAALCTAGLTLVIAVLLGLMLWRIGVEGAALVSHLPALFSRLSELGSWVDTWSYRFLVAAPPTLRTLFKDTLDSVIAQGLSLPQGLYDWLTQGAAWAAAALPQAGLFLFTCVLATYFTSAHRPYLRTFWAAQLPSRWQLVLHTLQQQLRETLGGWLRTQGLLMLITFGELTLGFLFLRVETPILLAALVALVDALPIFGTGTVLLPWAVFSLLGGRTGRSAGLLVLYMLVSLVRSLLEPKLLGDRMGVHPLAALVALYLGFQIFGIWGMIFSPLAITFLKQLHTCGIVKLWRETER